MSVTNTETFTNPRDNLPNVYMNVAAREVDFVTVFGQDWDALRKIFGIMRPIRKTPGTKLASYSASITLESGDVDPGCVIPYSKSTITKTTYADLDIKKYAKAVPIEDVSKYGAEIAVEKSDEAFRNQLQMEVLTDFYAFLNTGELELVATTFQDALARAKGAVIDKFNKLRRTVTEVVGFANVLDFYEYLGAAGITVQTSFGMTYIQNFLGYSTLFLLSEPDIARGAVIACPVNNIDMYYVDPSDSEFAKLGLNYTVQGETNLIGFHAEGNYNTAVGEAFAIMGIKLWAEYLDGIAVATIDTTPTLQSITVTSTAGTTTGDTNIAVSGYTLGHGEKYVYKVGDTAPSVIYGQKLTTGWTEIVPPADITAATGKKITVAAIDSRKNAQAAGNTTVTAQT